MPSHAHHMCSYLLLSSHHFHHSRCITASLWSNRSWSILHDPHDFIEENPIGQPHVAVPGTLGNWVHFHVLAVEQDAVLSLHHLVKQLNLKETGGKTWVCIKETREEGGVATSLNLALVPDCGDSCIEAYGRCMEKNTRYLLHMASEDEIPPENNRRLYREKVNYWFLFPNDWQGR